MGTLHMSTCLGVVGCVSNTLIEMEFEWTIPAYFSLKTAANEYFESPPFTFCGCSWSLRVYPGGNVSDGWISVFLTRNDSGFQPITICFSVSAKLANEIDILEGKISPNDTFTKHQSSWGWKKFMKHDLENSASSSLHFLCHMKHVNTIEVTTLPREITELETLSRDFKDLFINKSDKCDIIINVKGVEFQAHQTILIARSPVLAAALDHDMLEKQTGVINIQDCDPNSFKDFLLYLYTGRIKNFSFKNAYHLFATAHKYDVKELRSLCASLIIRNIAVDNVCDVAILADLFEETELLHPVQIFFNRNFSKVISTNGWESLLESNCPLGTKLLRGVSSKDEF